MRRSVWVASVATAIVTLWAAGVSNAASWYSGARGGLSFASLRGDFADISDPETRLGPTVGGTFELEVARAWGVAVEVMYVQKGAKFEGEARDESGNPLGVVETNLTLEYAEVPILVRGWMSRGNVRPYVVGGPTFGFALSARAKDDLIGEQDLSDDLKPLDLGATVGAGVRLITEGPWRIDLEARYSRGFDDLWDISGNLESINEGFTVTLGASR